MVFRRKRLGILLENWGRLRLARALLQLRTQNSGSRLSMVIPQSMQRLFMQFRVTWPCRLKIYWPAALDCSFTVGSWQRRPLQQSRAISRENMAGAMSGGSKQWMNLQGSSGGCRKPLGSGTERARLHRSNRSGDNEHAIHHLRSPRQYCCAGAKRTRADLSASRMG